MNFNETRYIITNDKEYIADLYERVIFEIETLNDILNLEMWSSQKDAENDFNNFKNSLIDSELEYYEGFYVKPIKLCIEL